jgi:hypothetical protein
MPFALAASLRQAVLLMVANARAGDSCRDGDYAASRNHRAHGSASTRRERSSALETVVDMRRLDSDVQWRMKCILRT